MFIYTELYMTIVNNNKVLSSASLTIIADTIRDLSTLQGYHPELREDINRILFELDALMSKIEGK